VSVERFRKRLLAKRAQLLAEGDVEVVPEAGDDDTARRPDEDSAPLAEMHQVIASNRNRARTEQLEEIAEALVRLEEHPDDFGFCEDCGDDIPPRRLDLMPWARLCIPCQEARERDGIPAGRKHITDYK
jgi:DnaK suppressor protein